jgi:hypothetical protein
VQSLLGGDEALVFFLAGANESHVFALTREGFEWRTISLGEKNMAAKVAVFRRGLDVEELNQSMLESPSCSILLPHTSFTFAARAGRSVDKDNPELLIVPSGPLTALPFHLLVTDKPAIAVPRMQINDMSAYRDAPGEAACGHRASVGRKPEGFARVRSQRPGHEADDRLW